MLLNHISFLCGFLLFLLAFYLLATGNGNKFLNRLISLVMIARGYQLLLYTLADSGALVDYPYFVRLFDPIVYISPAAFYLYFKAFMKDQVKLQPYEWLHFLPICIGLADLTFWLGSSPEFKSTVILQMVSHRSVLFEGKFGLLPTTTGFLIRNLLFLTYLFISWRIFFRSGFWKTYKTNKQNVQWILCLLLLSTAGQLTFFVSLFLSYNNHFTDLSAIKYGIQISISLTLVLLLVVFLQPRFLFGYLLFSRSKEDFNRQLHTNLEEKTPEASAKSRKKLVHNKQEALYLRALEVFMEEEKPYLQADFKISMLSQQLNIPLHHCTYLLNYSLEKNFNDWVNEYRLQHFLHHYKKQSQIKTIEAIALESGFNNRRTFARAFVKKFGVNPSEYLSTQVEIASQG